MHKLQSLKLFKKYNIPTLKFKLLSNDNLKNQIKKFLLENKLSKFMVRTDGKGMYGPSINNTELTRDVLDKINGFINNGYQILIMEPGNIYRNFHSVNFLKDKNQIIIESVGPGFTATDIGRNSIVHERMIFSFPEFKMVEQLILIDQDIYSKQVNLKINEIGIDKAKKNHSYLLEYNYYIPLSKKEVIYLKKILPKLIKINKIISPNSDNFIVSMSFIDFCRDKIEPIFWDLYSLK